MADWGMAHLKTIAPEEIFEVGCGGGRNAHELLQKYPSSKVTAIDYETIVGEGMFHCYPAFPIVKEAKEGWDKMVDLIRNTTKQGV